MGNSQDKQSLRRAHSVPDTHALPPDAPVLYKEKSRSSQRLYQPNKGGGKQSKGKIGKKPKHQKEVPPEFQLPPSEAVFLPAFPLRGDLEDLDFEVVEVIAKGAYGNVIKVQREDDKRFYAAKILNKAQILEEGAVRQCKDEASIQSMAGQNPFIVKAYEYWQSHSNLYLVLDYVPHGDMFTLWTFHGAFPEDLVQLYIAEMSLVLDYLHSECVIYRDIKMENILFDAKGHIQLTDFGLAKWLQSGDSTRTVCGTLQYMAPEVLSVYPYGHPADWWSIGILMYTMLAGRYPVDGMDTHTRMAQKVFECDYLLPSDISDSAQDVINRILTKSPHKRLCELYYLQDLHFFQDLIFSDLTDGKINPVDVVPPDFFPMTGASWAPYVFSEEDNRQFDQFDDTNANYNSASATDEQKERHSSHDSELTHNNHQQLHQIHPQPLQRQHQKQHLPDEQIKSYDISPLHYDKSKAYHQSSTSAYNGNEQTVQNYSDKRDSTHNAINYDNDSRRRDRFDSSSSQPGPARVSEQISSSSSYNQNLGASESVQDQGQPTYPVSPTDYHRDYHQNGMKDSRYHGDQQRRGSRDSNLAPLTTNEQQNYYPSSQPPSLPQNPPPSTLTSQPVSSPYSTHNNTYKMMEPAPTVTLNVKAPANNKINNNFMQDSYIDQPLIASPLSATIVTSPTTKFPFSTNQMTGYGAVEEAKIQLPISPVVKTPTIHLPSQPLTSSQFVIKQSNPSASNSNSTQFKPPPQPPPQSSKPTRTAPQNQYHPQQQLPPKQETPPQPPPQSSKPTVYTKPNVALKPSIAPVPAVRKSFNTKKAYKPQNEICNNNSHVIVKPENIHDYIGNNNNTPTAQVVDTQGYASNIGVNHHKTMINTNNNNLDSKQDNPRPVPRPRPRQTIHNKPGEAISEPSGFSGLSQSQLTSERNEDEEQDAQPAGNFHWNLPTSSVPSFV